MIFNKSFCWPPNLSNDDQETTYARSEKLAVDFKGQDWKRMWKMTFLGQDLEKQAAIPPRQFIGVPPVSIYLLWSSTTEFVEISFNFVQQFQ